MLRVVLIINDLCVVGILTDLFSEILDVQMQMESVVQAEK